ncbi:MAG: cupin domain-containing protein, partial [Granulosicoccus sp.]
DEYDVFLLQASGIRTWAIDSSGQQLNAPVQSGNLRILESFEPTDVWDLAAGDMLYLPAGFAHHGIAKGENCTTWSIGFRAPLYSDMIYRMADQITQLYAQHRFRDGPLDITNAGQISHQVIRQFHKIWTEAVRLDDAQFTQLIGQWLTETDNLPEVVEGAVVHTGKTEFSVSPFSRLGWIERNEVDDGDTVWLFADGARHECPREFAVRLCNSVYTPLPYETITRSEMALIGKLVSAGSISQSERHSDTPSDA